MNSPNLSAEKILENLPRVNVKALYTLGDFYSYKYISLHKVIDEITLDGDWAQFGVYKGRLAQLLQNYLTNDRKLHLFDSFEGLPSDWVGQWKAGDFALTKNEIPIFNSNDVHVYKGWFSDTAPSFAKTALKPLSFIHMDCDLYSSTKDVLFNLNELIVPGTVILFDEYMMISEGHKDDGEHRALLEWCELYERRFEYLWRTDWVQVAIRIIE